MTQERKQLGWQLVPIFEPVPGSIQTQAFIHCCLCGKAIAGTGGPRVNAYCLDCIKEEQP